MMTNFIFVILSKLLRVVKLNPFLQVADNLYLIQSSIPLAKVKFFKEVREYCELLSNFLNKSKGWAAATVAVSLAAAAAAAAAELLSNFLNKSKGGQLLLLLFHWQQQQQQLLQ